jgi:hypothetical protein
MLFDVYDRGGPPSNSLLGKARNADEARELALTVYRREGYPDPLMYACEFVSAEKGGPFFEVELTYAVEG